MRSKNEILTQSVFLDSLIVFNLNLQALILKLHRTALILLYTLTITCVVLLFKEGGNYFFQPLIDRPHNPLHATWKPGGFIGHGVGVIGSALILVLFLYSARKRFRFMRKWGNIGYWLDYHIWMGITGPILVVFHSTFKVHGIIAISFWSMVAVALSGILGRYLYLQIPRSLNGDELSASELDSTEDKLMAELRDFSNVDEQMLKSVTKIIGVYRDTRSLKKRALINWIISDFGMPFRMARFKSSLKQNEKLSQEQTRNFVKIVRKLSVLKRRIVFLQQAQALLHYWHIIHKPFAYVMIAIMMVHVVISILFGYKWIFSSHV